jgi:hypothetical protein
MDKNIHPIDETFQNAFESFSPEPPAMVWENISEALPQKRKKIGAIFWLLPLLLSVGLLGYYVGKTDFWEAKSEHQGEKQESHQAKETDNFEKKSNEILPLTNEKLNFIDEKNINVPLKKSSRKEKFASSISNENFDNRVVEAEKHFAENLGFGLEQEVNTKSKIEKIEVLSLLKKDIKEVQSIDNHKIMNIEKTKDCFSFEQSKVRSFYIEPYLGYDFVKPFFKQNTDTEPSAFPQVRDSSEHYRIAYSGGLRAGWIFENGMTFRTGVQSGHLVEKINFVLSTEKKTTTVVNEVKNSSGQVIKFDTVTTTQIGTKYKEVNNRYTTLDIPFQVGFEGNPKYNDWVFRGHAGILANLMFKKSGMIYDENLKIVDIKDNPSIYKSKMGLSLTASAGFARYFGEHVSTSVELQGLYNLKRNTVKTYSLDQKNLRMGIHFGIRYHF